MNKAFKEHINEWLDAYDLFSRTGKKNIRNEIKSRFPNISDEEFEEYKDYLEKFYEYCLNYADILADKYKTPFLPKDEEAMIEVDKYVAECQKKYPEINREIIVGVFSTACWLSNR